MGRTPENADDLEALARESVDDVEAMARESEEDIEALARESVDDLGVLLMLTASDGLPEEFARAFRAAWGLTPRRSTPPCDR
jgi:hypothetical protein